jgi:hypothetical protein
MYSFEFIPLNMFGSLGITGETAVMVEQRLGLV